MPVRTWLTCVAMGALLAVGAAAPALDRPDTPVLKEVTALLSITDGSWIDRQVINLAAANGDDPVIWRERIGRSLYLSNGYDGIDLTRPALIGWRPGPAGLVAVLPIKDRKKFLDGFGVAPGGDAPLVRVGDREGTLVLTQNRGGVRDEYRMLVTDDTAYLARTPEECRQLSLHPLVLSTALIASFTAWGPFTGGLPTGITTEIPDLTALVPKTRLAPTVGILASTFLQPMLDQVTTFSWQLTPTNTGAALSADLQLTSDGSLASWLRSQSNQGSRLLPAVHNEGSALLVYGQFSWQGQCETYGETSAADLKSKLPWTPEVDAAWRTVWSLLDRSGGFAWDLHFTGNDGWGAILTAEQADAAEFAKRLTVLATNLQSSTSELVTINDQTATRLSGDQGTVLVSTGDRHVVLAEGTDAEASTGVALAKLVTPSPPTGANGLLVAIVDISRWVRHAYTGHLEDGTTLPPVVITAVAKTGKDALHLDANVPITDLVALLNKLQNSKPQQP
jgi:hypothetical protein